MSQLRVNSITNVGGLGPSYASGHVVGFSQTNFTTQWTTTSTSYALLTSASITLNNPNSKVFIFANFQISARGSVQVQRGSTVIYDPPINFHIYEQQGTAWNSGTMRTQYPVTVLDTPGATSVTYNFYARAHDGLGVGFNENGNGTSKIFLMEVAA